MGCKHSTVFPENVVVPKCATSKVVREEPGTMFSTQSTDEERRQIAENEKRARLKILQELRAVAFDVLINSKPGWKMGANLSPEQMVRCMERAGIVRLSREERELMVEVVKEQNLNSKGKNIEISLEDQEKIKQRMEAKKRKLKEEYLRDRKMRKEKLKKKKQERAERIRQLMESASRK